MTTKDLLDPCEGMMLENLRRQRDELLTALKALVWQHDNVGRLCGMALQDARAAIRAAEGEAQR